MRARLLPSQPRDPERERLIARQAAGVAGSVIPIGIVFGAAAADAGLLAWEAVAYSIFVFGASAQLVAVEGLSDGAPLVTAIVAGLLVNMRFIAVGLSVSTILEGSLWRRILLSQIVIDQTAAVATGHHNREWGRIAFIVTGLGLFVAFALATLAGNSIISAQGSLIQDLGLDAVIPALFLALLWPRLASPRFRRAAIAGAAIGLATTPFAPVGVPLMAATAGALAAAIPGRLPWK